MTNSFLLMYQEVDGVFDLHSKETLIGQRVPYGDIPVDEITVYEPVYVKLVRDGTHLNAVAMLTKNLSEYTLDEDASTITLRWRYAHKAQIIRFRDGGQMLEFFEWNEKLHLISDSGYVNENGTAYRGLIT